MDIYVVMKKLLVLFLSLYLFSMPWGSFYVNHFNFMFSPHYIFLVVAFILFCFIYLLHRKPLRVPKLIIPLIILLMYASITLLWTQNLNNGLGTVVYLWTLMLKWIFVIIAVRYIECSSKLLFFYAMGLMLVLTLSYIDHGITDSRFSILGGMNPSWVGAYLIWGIIISIKFMSSYRSIFFKIVFLGLLLYFGFSLFLTSGRNAIISMLIAMLFSSTIVFVVRQKYILHNVNLRSLLLKAIIISASVFAGFVIWWSLFSNVDFDFFVNRLLILTDAFSGDRAQATANRNIIWSNYLDIIDGHVIIGNGVDSGYVIYGRNFGRSQTAHNSFITILVDYGLIGILLWIVFLLKLINASYKEYSMSRDYSLLWLSFTLFLLGFGNDVLIYRYWWTGILLFILLLLDENKKQKVRL